MQNAILELSLQTEAQRGDKVNNTARLSTWNNSKLHPTWSCWNTRN